MNEKLMKIYNDIVVYIEDKFTEYLFDTKQVRTFIVAYLFALRDNDLISDNEYIELINEFYFLDWKQFNN